MISGRKLYTELHQGLPEFTFGHQSVPIEEAGPFLKADAPLSLAPPLSSF
jgi:hypothetical protein